MSLVPEFLETCADRKILIIDPYYNTPQVETGLELAEVLSEKNDVLYVGPDALRCTTDYTYKLSSRIFKSLTRKRAVSKRVTKRARTLSRQEVDRIVRGLDVPDPSTFLDLSDSDLRSVKVDNFDIGMGLVSSLISLARDPYVDLGRYRRFATALAHDALVLYALTAAIIRTHTRDTVMFFNGRQAPVRGIRRAAEKMGARFIAFERGSSNDRFALFEGHTPHHPEGFRTWVDTWWTAVDDPEGRARQFLTNRRNGTPTDWYSFTGNQELGQLPPRDSRRRITFFTSSEDELSAVGDELKPDTPLCDQAHSIRVIGQACAERGVEYVVRFHPNTAASESALFEAAADAGGLVIEPGSKVDTYALMDSSDIVFTHSSTVGLEAACAGKPVYFVGRNYYERCTSVKRLVSDAEVAEALDVPMIPDVTDALKYANYFASHGIPYRYYKPRGFLSGAFKGLDLNWPLSHVLDLKLRLVRGGI